MPSLMQETPGLDTSGYATHYNTIRDLTSLPGARVQQLDAGVSSQAFVQASGATGLVFDHDTFVASLQSGHEYRLQITPDNPSALAYNKIALVYQEGGGYLDKQYVLNATNSYVEGSIYSDIFSASETDEHYIGLSMNVLLGYGQADSQTVPYRIKLIDLTAGTPVDEPRVSLDQVEKISLLYASALDRKPDAAGLNYWVDEFESGLNIAEIALSFIDSQEFTSRFDVATDRGYIERLYTNVLDRAPDQAGVDYFLNDMANGQSRTDVLLSFAQSAENRGNAGDWLAGLEYDAGAGEWLV